MKTKQLVTVIDPFYRTVLCQVNIMVDESDSFYASIIASDTKIACGSLVRNNTDLVASFVVPAINLGGMQYSQNMGLAVLVGSLP